jgi:hypothetical protein
MVGPYKNFISHYYMKKKLIILNSHYLSQHNYNIHGIDYFKKNLNCEIYDLSYLTNKLLKKNPKSYKFINLYSFKKLKIIFKNNRDAYYLDMLMASPKAIIIRLMMHFYKLNTISIKYLSGFPNIKFRIRIKSFLNLFNFNKVFIFLMDRVFSLLLKQDINVCSGTSNNILNTKKNTIYAASTEYSHYLYNKKKILKKKYAVYADTNFLDHPDSFKRQNRELIILDIYNKINLFFKKFCLLTGYDLIILAHPTSNNNKQLERIFSDYNIIKNKTANLLNGSQMLFNTHSTVYALAVLYNKPIIHLTSKLINDYLNNRNIVSLISKDLGSASINIDDFMLNKEFLNKKDFSVNKKKYQIYKNKYLKHPKSSNIHWFQTVSSHLGLSKPL